MLLKIAIIGEKIRKNNLLDTFPFCRIIYLMYTQSTIKALKKLIYHLLNFLQKPLFLGFSTNYEFKQK